MKAIAILIDGPAGVGKSAVADRLAEYFGFRHVDSGLCYRAVGLRTIETRLDPVQIAKSLEPEDLMRDDLRTDKAAKAASTIAVMPAVREAINNSLRSILAKPPGTIMGGRAGAWEFPEAQVKIFLTASIGERAKRRCAQLSSRENEVDFTDVFIEIAERDKRDRERETSPLKPGPGAVVVDNTSATEEETFQQILAICVEQMNLLPRPDLPMWSTAVSV